jgi:hypothetical protein
MKKVSAEMVPKNFTNDQLQRRKEIYADRLQQLEQNDERLYRIITWDESSVFLRYKGRVCNGYQQTPCRKQAGMSKSSQESVDLYL